MPGGNFVVGFAYLDALSCFLEPASDSDRHRWASVRRAVCGPINLVPSLHCARTNLHSQGGLEEGTCPESKLVEGTLRGSEYVACAVELVLEELVKAASSICELVLSFVVDGRHWGGGGGGGGGGK